LFYPQIVKNQMFDSLYFCFMKFISASCFSLLMPCFFIFSLLFDFIFIIYFSTFTDSSSSPTYPSLGLFEPLFFNFLSLWINFFQFFQSFYFFKLIFFLIFLLTYHFLLPFSFPFWFWFPFPWIIFLVLLKVLLYQKVPFVLCFNW
jgi:hypothetical protein